MKPRTFTMDDQAAFARLSGDGNPLHLDAVAARRSIFGAPVVHGVHSLLWGLDGGLGDEDQRLAIRSLRAVFPKPIRVGEEVSLSARRQDAGPVIIELRSGGTMATRIEVEWSEAPSPHTGRPAAGFPELRPSRVLTVDDIHSRAGVLELFLDDAEAARLFPRLFRRISPWTLAAMLGSTRLVGVECPGLHSIYSELELTSNTTDARTTLNYQVTKLDRRFGLVVMGIQAPGLTGTITAFIRPKPAEQASYLDLKKQVNNREFAGQRALVLGGSRGLGEVCAKLLAAGSAEVKITYHQGRDDAQRIVDEIVSANGRADRLSFNVLSPSPDSVPAGLGDWTPTHLYYFATPYIAPGARGSFSPDQFSRFCRYYVAGFSQCVELFKRAGLNKVFYPSSVFVDEQPPDMAEYTAAKMAGETLCASMEKDQPGLIIYRPRLPRLSTDQTVSLFAANHQDPVPVMLEHLRKFRDLSGPA